MFCHNKLSCSCSYMLGGYVCLNPPPWIEFLQVGMSAFTCWVSFCLLVYSYCHWFIQHCLFGFMARFSCFASKCIFKKADFILFFGTLLQTYHILIQSIILCIYTSYLVDVSIFWLLARNKQHSDIQQVFPDHHILYVLHMYSSCASILELEIQI